MKTFLIISSIFISSIAFCQSDDYSLLPMQAGTINLVSGKATVSLTINSISALSPQNGGESYYVELTPIGNCGPLKLDEKGDKSFSVSTTTAGAGNASFDYIIFIKYHPVQIGQDMRHPVAPAPGK